MDAGQFTIPMRDYLALDAFSSGICHILLSQSPAHARYVQQHPTPSTGAMDLGTIAHQMLLENSAEGITVFDPADYPNAKGDKVATGWTNVAIRTARDAERAAGKTPILVDEMMAVMEMVHTARTFVSQSEIAGVFDRGRPEQTLIWDDDGLWCKERPDWLTDDCRWVVHYKTNGRRVEPQAFIRGPLDYMGYDLALVFYERGMRAVHGFDARRQSVILAQETDPPYACALIGLSPGRQEIAGAKVEHAIRVWRECVKTGKWPSYSTRIHYAEPTSWQINAAASMMLDAGDHERYEQIIDLAGGLR
jgi:hypothetical protein